MPPLSQTSTRATESKAFAAPWAAYEEGEEARPGTPKRRSSVKSKKGEERFYNRKDVAPFAFPETKTGSAKEDIAIQRRSIIGKA